MVRTLHCGKSTINFNLCLDNKVAGFTHRGPTSGELIYLLVKNGKKTYCGARFVLAEETDEKPWEDADRYVVSFSVNNIEFCEFFDVSFLKKYGGEYWPLKYLQGAKNFDEAAALALDNEFNKHKRSSRPITEDKSANDTDDIDNNEDSISVTKEEEKKIEKEVPEEKLNIMGTFQTINFKNESDSFRGLERLVTDNFFDLFPKYKKENTILISKNRLFRTHQMNESVAGVSAIPDALLITFREDRATPINISLVEYECYGEGKLSASLRSKYMNSHIIPQLMQFASSFSIITDQQTRENTISDWIDKIISETSTDELSEKVDSWIRRLKPEIKEREIISIFEKKLREAFKSSVKVLLIIDELSSEQKETIKNIISSFKLESSADIQFDSSVVKLVQKINLINENFEYGLTAQ